MKRNLGEQTRFLARQGKAASTGNKGPHRMQTHTRASLLEDNFLVEGRSNGRKKLRERALREIQRDLRQYEDASAKDTILAGTSSLDTVRAREPG